ncbi:MAG: 2Fe-2S iron-sulfur cluster-binding protein [Myxococcota bacterium]
MTEGSAQVTVEGFAPFVAALGRSLLELCEEAGVPMDSACGGFAACNSCRVEVVLGEDGLSPRLPEEDPFLDAPGQRLGCQARLRGPVTIRLAPG